MAGSSRKDDGRCWCLRRRGMASEWLLLENNAEVTIGRGLGLTYQLVSKRCPLMVSRTHCIFLQNEEGTWTVTDNKSLNGVYLNRERLNPSKAYPIYERDLIQLGVPVDDGERAEYEYELIHEDRERIEPFLTPQLKGKMKGQRTKRKFSACDQDTSAAESSSNSKSKSLRVTWAEEEQSRFFRAVPRLAKQATEKVEPRLPVAGPSTFDASQPDCSTQAFQNTVSFGTQAVEKATSRIKESTSIVPLPSRSTIELSKVRETMQEIRKLKVRVQEKQTAVLSMKQHSKKRAHKEVREMERELQDLHDQLRTEQERQLQRVKQLEKTFFEEEQQLEGAKNSEGDKSLKEQLAQALQEHTLLMEELNRSKKDFEQIIQAKNKELQETMEEKEKVQAQKEEVLNQMNDVLDNELQCIICSEHFIEAVTLNCAHSFCCYCIKEWIKRKVECPICRQVIVTQTRSIVLDNCIERMVENLSLEMKQHRLALINERKEINEKQEAERPVKSDSESSIMSSIDSIMSISSFESDSDDFYEENFDYEGFEDTDEDDDDHYLLI